MAFTVDHYEMAGYPRGVWQEGEFVGTRKLRCAWTDRAALVSDFSDTANMGWPYDNGPSDALARYAADFPVGKQGVDLTDVHLATYEEAEVIVKYYTRGPTLIGGATLISERLQPDVTTKRVSPGFLRWDDNDGAVVREHEAPDYMLYGLSYIRKYHGLLTVPGWVLANVGTCNSNILGTYILGLSFPAETLKYIPPTIEDTVSMARITTFDVTTRYRYRPASWNKHWHQESATYRDLYVAGGDRWVRYPPVRYRTHD